MNGVPSSPAALLDREADEILAHLANKPTDVLVVPQDVGMPLMPWRIRLRFCPHMQRLLEEDVKRSRQTPDIHAACADHFPRAGRREYNHSAVRLVPDWTELNKSILMNNFYLLSLLERIVNAYDNDCISSTGTYSSEFRSLIGDIKDALSNVE